ncbi:MAG: IS110 family transposase [Methylobacter sp.]|nr:IS110 family transposase [Methylobacter sp.]
MSKIVIGVDIAKKKFDVASLNEGKYKHQTFTNDEPGYAGFIIWIVHLFANDKPLICREATGAYSIPLADFMVSQGYPVRVVNPAKITAFAKSELSRAKTDKADAKLIARYASIIQPPLWTPPSHNIRVLQAWVRRVEHLLEMIQRERNRLETSDITVVDSLNAVLATLETELEATRKAIREHIDNDPELKCRGDLLITIPGIADASIAHFLVVLSEHHGFISAKPVVAFAGLAPALRQSGQWSGKTHIAKSGEAVTLLCVRLCIGPLSRLGNITLSSANFASVLKPTARTVKPLFVPLGVSLFILALPS